MIFSPFLFNWITFFFKGVELCSYWNTAHHVSLLTETISHLSAADWKLGPWACSLTGLSVHWWVSVFLSTSRRSLTSLCFQQTQTFFVSTYEQRSSPCCEVKNVAISTSDCSFKMHSFLLLHCIWRIYCWPSSCVCVCVWTINENVTFSGGVMLKGYLQRAHYFNLQNHRGKLECGLLAFDMPGLWEKWHVMNRYTG